MELISAVSILLITFLLAVMINFLFTMYHLYMRKKSEYQYRLLNLLYGQLALILQFGSLLNIIIIVRWVFLLDNDIFTFGIQLVRNVQVLTGFLQSTLLGWSSTFTNTEQWQHLYKKSLLHIYTRYLYDSAQLQNELVSPTQHLFQRELDLPPPPSPQWLSRGWCVEPEGGLARDQLPDLQSLDIPLPGLLPPGRLGPRHTISQEESGFHQEK